MEASVFSLICAIGACLLSGGWAVFGLVSGWAPAGPAPLSLLGVLLAGVALAACAVGDRLRRPGRRVGALVSALVIGVGSISLLRVIDTALYAHPATSVLLRAPPMVAAVSVVLSGVALRIFCSERTDRFGLADVTTAASLFLPVVSIIDGLYGHRELRGDSGFTIAWPVALGLLLVGGGLLRLNRQMRLQGWLHLAGDGVSQTRRLLPAAILAPTLLGLGGVKVTEIGLLSPTLAMALIASAGIVGLTVLIFWNEELTLQLEADRRRDMLAREARAQREATSDALTGLINRRGWDAALTTSEIRVRGESADACVIAIDIDGLKQVNDTQGHAEGDALLRRAGYALREATRPGDRLARLGGDEFAVLLTDADAALVGRTLNQLRDALARHGVEASIGFALRSTSGSLQEAWRDADESMYEDKRNRRLRRGQGPMRLGAA